MTDTKTLAPISDFRLDVLLQVHSNQGRPRFRGWRTLRACGRLIHDGYLSFPADDAMFRDTQQRGLEPTDSQIHRFLSRSRVGLELTPVGMAMAEGIKRGEKREAKRLGRDLCLDALKRICSLEKPLRVQNMYAKPSDTDAPRRIWNFTAIATSALHNIERRKKGGW